MDMKTISAPYVPQLDELQNPDEISTMLETMGTRSQINVLNWPDKFAYAPLANIHNCALRHSNLY